MPRCAWCGRPGETFVAGHAHCGGSHVKRKPTHLQEVALREAAAAWGKALSAPVRDARDSDSRRLNARLLRAALRYADAVHAQ